VGKEKQMAFPPPKTERKKEKKVRGIGKKEVWRFFSLRKGRKGNRSKCAISPPKKNQKRPHTNPLNSERKKKSVGTKKVVEGKGWG